MAGKQSLGSIWGHLKRKMRGVKASTPKFISRILREGQWCHWIGTEDRYKAMGDVLRFCREEGVIAA